MSRKAILPTGQAIEFPDETPDHEIHAAVRSQMGLPPPHQVDGPAAIEAMSAMQQSFAELSGHLAAAIQMMQTTSQHIAQAVQRFDEAAQTIAHTVEAGAQRVAQSVAIGTDKMIHVSGEAAHVAASGAGAVHDAARRIEGSVATAAEKMDGSIDHLIEEIRRPKRAAKLADGSWVTTAAGAN